MVAIKIFLFFLFANFKIFLCAIGTFSIPISFDKSPLSIKKFFPFLKIEDKLLIAALVYNLNILFSLGKILKNFLISSSEFTKDRA